MPKSTFFNISKDKQKRIIDIAIEEFTSKSFEEVSVNSIIKKADISRGSFYTYFDDLDELFDYIVMQVKEDRLTYAKNLFKEANGDYFVFIKSLFTYDFDAFKDTNKYSLFRNYVRHIQFGKKESLKSMLFNPLYKSFVEDEKFNFEKIFDLNLYAIKEDEILDLLEMTFLIMIDTYFKSETENLNKKEVIALFDRRISIIEHGVKK